MHPTQRRQGEIASACLLPPSPLSSFLSMHILPRIPFHAYPSTHTAPLPSPFSSTKPHTSQTPTTNQYASQSPLRRPPDKPPTKYPNISFPGYPAQTTRVVPSSKIRRNRSGKRVPAPPPHQVKTSPGKARHRCPHGPAQRLDRTALKNYALTLPGTNSATFPDHLVHRMKILLIPFIPRVGWDLLAR